MNQRLDELAAFESGGFPVVSLYLNTRPDQHGRDNFDLLHAKEVVEALGRVVREEEADHVAPADGRKRGYTPAAAGVNSGAEGFLPGARSRQSAETRTAKHGHLQRRRRLIKLRGLSAKRLSERRRLQREAGLS